MEKSIPSKLLASVAKAIELRGEVLADQQRDMITSKVLFIMKKYYENLGKDDEMMEEARLAGYEDYDAYLEETDDYRTLVMELAGSFIRGFDAGWFYSVE